MCIRSQHITETHHLLLTPSEIKNLVSIAKPPARAPLPSLYRRSCREDHGVSRSPQPAHLSVVTFSLIFSRFTFCSNSDSALISERVGDTETYQDFEQKSAEKDERRSKEGRASIQSKDGDLWFSLFNSDKLCSAPRLRNIFIRSGFVCFFSPNAIKSGSTYTANNLPLTPNEYSLIFRQNTFFFSFI